MFYHFLLESLTSKLRELGYPFTMGISPPKNSPQDCFCPAGRERGAATCGYRIRLRPLGGACLLRPLRLLRLPVSAAGGGRLRSRLFDSRTPLLTKRFKAKKKAQPLMRLSFLVTLPSISRALKTARRAVFAPRDADAGPGLFDSRMGHHLRPAPVEK